MIGVTQIKIGEVTDYFSAIQVAVVHLSADIHVGDRIKFQGSHEFSQILEHLQIEHQTVDFAKKSDIVGIKVNQPVSVGDELVKLL